MRLFLILMLMFTAILSDDDYKEDHYKKKDHIPYDMEHLGLDKKQKKKIRSIMRQNRYRLQKLHDIKEDAEETIERLFTKDSFDKKRFKSMMMRIKKESVDIEADLLESLHKTLTPKQRKLFLEYIEEWEVD